MTTITINNKTYEVSEEQATALETLIADKAVRTVTGKRWRAKPEEKHYYLGSDGSLETDIEISDPVDDYRYSIGNYFKTDEQAESYKQRLIAEQAIRDSSDYVPDWTDLNDKHYVVLLLDEKKTTIWSAVCHRIPGVTYYRTKADAKAALDNPDVAAAYKTVFGVV